MLDADAEPMQILEDPGRNFGLIEYCSPAALSSSLQRPCHLLSSQLLQDGGEIGEDQ